MRVAIGSNHAGYQLKESLKTYLTDLRHSVLDLGTHSVAPVDHPDFAEAVEAVGLAALRGSADRGIVICGSGVGGVDCRKQDSENPRRSLPRYRLGSPGSPARRYERPRHG